MEDIFQWMGFTNNLSWQQVTDINGYNENGSPLEADNDDERLLLQLIFL